MDADLPPALTDALGRDAEARKAFEGLPPSHRREYVEWVAEAKRQDTRERRAAKAVEMLRAGGSSPG